MVLSMMTVSEMSEQRSSGYMTGPPFTKNSTMGCLSLQPDKQAQQVKI
jgi:hypothetical protein